MLKNVKFQGILVLALGGLLGYVAATGRLSSLLGADKEKAAEPSKGVQVTDEPGSPAATRTIDGKQLPPPDPKFGGVIKPGNTSAFPEGKGRGPATLRIAGSRRRRPFTKNITYLSPMLVPVLVARRGIPASKAARA